MTNPPPMPSIRESRIYLPDAIEALGRAQASWNATQLRDALASAKFFIECAEAAIVDDVRVDPPPKPSPPPIQVLREVWWPKHPCG